MDSNTRIEYYPQWLDTRRGKWVTPTHWLLRGGYPTEQEARTIGAAYCRQDSPDVRVRVRRRVVTDTVFGGEVPVPDSSV